MVRMRFTQQLERLEYSLLRMGSLVDEAIAHSVHALVNRDSNLARRVIERDQEINDLRYKIEEQCYTLVATQQPLAHDLRRITAAISIATNMERMADHAAGIAVLTRRLNKEGELREALIDIPRMCQIARFMLRGALDAYIKEDAELAHQIIAEDKKINQLDEQLLPILLTFMIENPSNIRRATYMLWISHNLERIGDRCKNICERVVYIVTGTLADFDSYEEHNQAIDESEG